MASVFASNVSANATVTHILQYVSDASIGTQRMIAGERIRYRDVVDIVRMLQEPDCTDTEKRHSNDWAYRRLMQDVKKQASALVHSLGLHGGVATSSDMSIDLLARILYDVTDGKTVLSEAHILTTNSGSSAEGAAPKTKGSAKSIARSPH